MLKSLKPIGRALIAALGFVYDAYRYLRYSGWRKNLHDTAVRDYHLAKVSHALEKSMAYYPRNPDSGWSNALELTQIIEESCGKDVDTFQRKVSMMVLREFVELPENRDQQVGKSILSRLEKVIMPDTRMHGTRSLTKEDLRRGVMTDPERFFLSRASIRDYSDEVPSRDIIERGVSLAMGAPSACNRQPWSVYYTLNPEARDSALKFQSGNRGFGHLIPCLMVVAVDQRAFMPGQERYQHWIDGGMFAMSLIYAFHSLGLVTCALNWSQSPRADFGFRKAFNIANEDSIIMMLGVGFPKIHSLSCASERRPMSQTLRKLKRRD